MKKIFVFLWIDEAVRAVYFSNKLYSLSLFQISFNTFIFLLKKPKFRIFVIFIFTGMRIFSKVASRFLNDKDPSSSPNFPNLGLKIIVDGSTLKHNRSKNSRFSERLTSTL